MTEEGALVIPVTGRSPGCVLDVPAVYVAYFATFGAMVSCIDSITFRSPMEYLSFKAWHLLLYPNSVETLYHPILAKHAVDSEGKGEKMAGDNLRARLCHFVRARFIATNFFISQKSNQDQACILLTRSFEQLACLSQNRTENSWIKSVFQTHAEQRAAEEAFQQHVYYTVCTKLGEYSKIVYDLQSKTQAIRNLHDYISKIPITIGFEHFQTELCNPKYSALPLTILKRFFDSFDDLSLTKYIYDLSRFYLLLHRTYARLIEKDKFSTISLKELYERSQKHFRYLGSINQADQHLSIIEKGISAVNSYHKAVGGQIRPGACDVSKTFEPIAFETPVSYLVQNEDPDEGDIIMRILR